MKISNKFRHAERSDERGVTMVLVAIAMVAIIAMAAMSIDLVTLYLAREEAQRSADNAALAAARVISASGITGTAAPANNPAAWSLICGPITVGTTNGGWATQAATSVAAQNTVGGRAANVNVTYSDGKTSGVSDCSTLSAIFAVNPMVTVQITPVIIPSFFSRIWGSTGNTVSASATAEAFNPSDSGNNGVTTTSVTPVQPRCVKPWIVPNLDPHDGTCSSTTCLPFVNLPDGSVVNHGISLNGNSGNGVIGEEFTIFPNCPNATGSCGIAANPPGPNISGTNRYSGQLPPAMPPPNLQYLPGQVLGKAAAIPSCSVGTNNYQYAVAGCDTGTVYQCGVQVPLGGTPNEVDLNENPGGPGGDTAMGVACTLTNSTTIPLDGQDVLRVNNYPFLPFAGDANPAVPSGTPVTNSNSVMTLPIYDQTKALVVNGSNLAPVTIVGFLQVFVKDVNADGSVVVYVLNVAGCSNTATSPPVLGNSPLPVRLITPP